MVKSLCFQAKLPAQTEVVTSEDLMAHLGKSSQTAAGSDLMCLPVFHILSQICLYMYMKKNLKYV